MTPEELRVDPIHSGRIAGALGLIASAIFIWLGFRVAVVQSTNIWWKTTRAAKYSPLYFVLYLYGCLENMVWRICNIYFSWRGLENLKEGGISITDTAEEFIGFIGTSEVTNTPEPLGILFIIIIAIMYLSIIWVPKQN